MAFFIYGEKHSHRNFINSCFKFHLKFKRKYICLPKVKVSAFSTRSYSETVTISDLISTHLKVK